MDALYQIFQSTLDPHPNVRVRAELDLRQIEAQDGMVPSVLRIVASDEANSGIRQAAAM